MSTNANLANGQFITSINGKRCTAVPKAGGGGGGGGGSAATTAANNNNNNGGNAQATPNAVQAASSSTTDSTKSTSTFVKTTSTSTSTTSTSTSTTSTSTSIIISTSTQEANAGLAPAVQETTTDSPPPPDTTSSAIPTFQTVPAASSPQAQAQAQTTPVSIQASQADTGVIATLATAAATTAATDTAAGAAVAASSPGAAAAASAATGSPLSITNGNGAAIFSTIAAPPGATDDGSSTAAAAAAGGDGSNPALGAVTSTPGTNPETTIAIAGGVIGGVAFLSLVAFLVWFWRRRVKKRRRSTLLTPLSTDPATFGGSGGGDATLRNGEKGEYVINRGSIGPTPKTERIKATFDYNIRRIKGRFGDMMTSRASNGSVNMDRGNSQFMGPDNMSGNRDSNTTNGSGNSDVGNGGYGAAAKDKVTGWFGRVAGAGAGLTSKFRGGNGDGDSQDEKRAMGAQPNKKDGQPDFLTLLGMDERELERAAQNKKNSKKKRASMDRGRYGSSSNNDYLGRLNIDFDDPFSDKNAIAHQSAKPAPLTVSQANNPFSDANAIRSNNNNNNNGEYSTLKPNTYVADIRRSRGQNDPLANFRADSMYRDSVQTVNTVDTSAKRNRFRSDPFDLERPELLQLGRSTPKTATSSNMSVAGSSTAPRLSDGSGSRLSGGVGTGEVRRPRAAHQRGDSLTSKYSSGVSMGDWSDPGPDVGPSAPMWGDSSSDRRRDSPTKGRLRSNSDESSTSVGKAL